MTFVDKYLKLVSWARRRYTDSNHYLLISTGGKPGILSKYSLIERAAWNKHMKEKE